MDPIESRVNFYANLKQLAEKEYLVSDTDCAYLVGENPNKFLSGFPNAFGADCLLVTYCARSYCRTLITCFNVWGKFSQDESLFIIGLAPHYVKTFCEAILPALKTNCSTVSLAVYSQLHGKLVELYCNF